MTAPEPPASAPRDPQEAAPEPPAPVEPAVRVSTLELFFDLVFVFTLTQLTTALIDHFDATGIAQVLLMLGVIWWMYGGYAWLTNAVAPSSTTRRTLLLTGMAGFLVIALAIPNAFDNTDAVRDSGWVFGVGYLVVNLAHSALFLYADDRRAARSVLSLAPFNLVSALLVFAGGFLPEAYRYGLWTAALALQIATPYLHRIGGFSLVVAHFVERHSLVVIIAIGESMVAVGLGFAGVTIDFGAIAVAILGLCIAYYLWWAYFAGDEARAEHALAAITDPVRQARTAIQGWGYAHYFMILGIVLLAAGVKKTVGHAFEPLAWRYAATLAAGAAVFLAGHAWFLRVLRISGVPHRLVAAAAILATIPLGHWYAVAQLVAVPLIMATAMIIEDIPRVRGTGGTAVHTFGRTVEDHEHG